MYKRLILLIVSIVFMFSATASAQLPKVVDFTGDDVKNDAGQSVVLTWPKQNGENPNWRYIIEASANSDGPWTRVARFGSMLQWKEDYPEIFGHPDENDLQKTHALKVSLAPPSSEMIGELKSKAEASLLAAKEKISNIEEKISKVKAEFASYSRQREQLQERLSKAPKGDDDVSRDKRVSIAATLEDLKRENRHLDRLYDQKSSVSKKIQQYTTWSPPVTTTLKPGNQYYFRISAEQSGEVGPIATTTATPWGNWINTNRLHNLLIALLLASLIIIYTLKARKNPENIFVRRIAGLEAVDDAIGRATEMGKPIFFVHGLANLASISTVAAINILGKIAEKVAEYGTEFKVTNRDPVVLAVSQETVKEAYLRTGRPDLYNEDHVFYVSQDQFSYATGVEGMFLREQPASCFYFGYYYAEALLLTETGSHIGAIQIAGTDSYTQLPFFITTCDYTLMGEELYAASAYMSREPKLLASLKAQDITKGILLIFALLGVVLSTSGIMWLVNWTESF